MRLLLDTHVFVWFIDGDPALPAAMDQAISDPDNEVFLSVAAVWEASIKYHLGKWPLPEPPEILFRSSGDDMASPVCWWMKTALRRRRSCPCSIKTHSTEL